MLICKNCHSENVDGAIKCSQCNMEGNFVYVIPNGEKSDFVPAENSVVHCQNCGSESPGTEEKCSQCNFPLPQITSKSQSKPETPDNNVQNQSHSQKRTYSPFQPWEISKQKTG